MQFTCMIDWMVCFCNDKLIENFQTNKSWLHLLINLFNTTLRATLIFKFNALKQVLRIRVEILLN